MARALVVESEVVRLHEDERGLPHGDVFELFVQRSLEKLRDAPNRARKVLLHLLEHQEENRRVVAHTG